MTDVHFQLCQYIATKAFASQWPREALQSTAYFIDNAFNLTEITNG